MGLKKMAYEKVAEQQIAPTGLETPAFRVIMSLLSHIRLLRDSDFRKLTEDLAEALTQYSAVTYTD